MEGSRKQLMMRVALTLWDIKQYPHWTTGAYQDDERVRFRWARTRTANRQVMIFAGSPHPDHWQRYPESWYFQVHEWLSTEDNPVDAYLKTLIHYDMAYNDAELGIALEYIKTHFDEMKMEKLL